MNKLLKTPLFLLWSQCHILKLRTWFRLNPCMRAPTQVLNQIHGSITAFNLSSNILKYMKYYKNTYVSRLILKKNYRSIEVNCDVSFTLSQWLIFLVWMEKFYSSVASINDWVISPIGIVSNFTVFISLRNLNGFLIKPCHRIRVRKLDSICIQDVLWSDCDLMHAFRIVCRKVSVVQCFA